MAMLYLRNKPIGAISSGSSGGGHTIENPTGTSMEQRSNLQFTDAEVSDDSTNDRTEISIVRELMQAEFDELTPEEQNRGVIVIKDANPSYLPSDNAVRVVADGVKTCSQLLNELFALIDKSKITRNTCIRTQNANGNYTMYSLSSARPSSDVYYFVTHQVANQKLNHYSIRIASSASILDAVENGVYSDYSSDVESSGYVYTLYYNIISTGLDAEIPAENVIYGNSNVKDALDGLLKLKVADITVTTNQYGQYYISEAYPNRVSVISMSNSYWCMCEGNYVRVYDVGATTKAINKEVPIRVLYY